MRSLGGFVLLAGLGVGLFVYFPAPVDRSTSLEQATRVVASRVAESVAESQAPAAPVALAPAPTRVASFSPGMSLTAQQHRKRAATAPAPVADSAAPAVKVETIANWQTTVAPGGSLEPTDADGRYKLVVDIQQQLKRVGCYWGRVNGSWTGTTREAMREFATRANSAVPVEKPDYLLLTLLKSHNGRSCGAPEATVAAAPAEVLPWKAGDTKQQASRLYTPVPTSAVTAEPLPGRMAIGGPQDLQPARQEPLVPGATPTQQPGVATAALEPSAGATGFGSPAPAVAPKPRPTKKASKAHRPSPGTPRYNLMLSLGGVY